MTYLAYSNLFLTTKDIDDEVIEFDCLCWLLRCRTSGPLHKSCIKPANTPKYSTLRLKIIIKRKSLVTSSTCARKPCSISKLFVVRILSSEFSLKAPSVSITSQRRHGSYSTVIIMISADERHCLMFGKYRPAGFVLKYTHFVPSTSNPVCVVGVFMHYAQI